MILRATLLLSLLGQSTHALTLPALAVRRAPAPARARAPTVWSSEYGDDDLPVDDDWDIAWQRYRLDALAEGWLPQLRLEALEGLPTVGKSIWWEPLGVAVAFGSLFCVVKMYLEQAGGILIVPDGPAIGLYSIAELKNMEPTKLLSFGLPMPVPPAAPTPPPPLMQHIRMLLGSVNLLLF